MMGLLRRNGGGRYRSEKIIKVRAIKSSRSQGKMNRARKKIAGKWESGKVGKWERLN